MNPVIELFRGLAALMVMTSHYDLMIASRTTILHYLSTGVELFFVISGFVFGKTIYKKTDLAVLPFFVRRFFRIYPLYLASLILYFIFSGQDPNKLFYLFKHLFLLQTTSSLQEAAFFNVVYWTLVAEAEFYLLVPVLASLSSKHKNLIPLTLLLGISANIFLVVKVAAPIVINAYALSLFHLPGVLTEFIIGVLLFRFYDKYKDEPISLSRYISIFTMGMLTFFLLGTYLFKIGYQKTSIIELRLTNVFFCSSCAVGYALILFPLLHRIRNTKLPFTKFCLFSGSVSYGIYLFHVLPPIVLKKFNLFPSFGLIAYFVCTAITIAMALTLHHVIEAPMRSFGRNISNLS